jgi:hypothetical protein
MASSFLSSLAETLHDPVLLRWRLARLRRSFPPPPAADVAAAAVGSAPLETSGWRDPGFPELPAAPPAGRLDLDLGASRTTIDPPDIPALFERRMPSQGTEALHAFRWLMTQPDMEADWVVALWRAWAARHGRPRRDDPAWHPTVAATRVVALLDYARQAGLPGPRQDSLAGLAAHGPAIAGRLGEGLREDADSAALQARGLYRLGLDLALEAMADRGLAVLLDQAARRIRPSGAVAGGSTKRHLRLTRCYADAWLAARRHGRPEAARLQAIVGSLLAVLRALTLPGGLPEIGEAPADNPLAFYAGLLPGGPADNGWTGRLPADERQALVGQRDAVGFHDLERLRADGWLRLDIGAWSGLWHASPDGWCDAAAGDHQDLGGFVLRYAGVPIFVDAGTPPPDMESELAALYRSAVAHNSLCLDGRDPYPMSRPFYSEAFRRAVGGPPPSLRSEYDGARLIFDGFHRLGGPRQSERRWRFEANGFTIDDQVLGTGHFRVERRLITPLPAVVEDDAVVLTLGDKRLTVRGGGTPTIHPERRWVAAGKQDLSVILFAARVNLPWRGRLQAELG